MSDTAIQSSRSSTHLYAAVSVLVGLIYYLSNPKPQHFYDYTFRVAENLLNGAIAFTEKQPSWLNEFVPFEGAYYSVFPLGAVLLMVPFAALKVIGVVTEMPAAFVAAMCAAVSSVFLFLIARRYDVTETRRTAMVLGILFGTWTWTNLTMAGAWQLALGFAMAAELGAIYFTVYDRRPLLAGLFFAIAFGNRTEILLTAPIFFYLLARPRSGAETPELTLFGRDTVTRIAAFCVVPFVLGVSTLVYNYVRFDSFTDFGYARIPGVLDEPWYNHGIFSVYYIPRQMGEMMWKPWEVKSYFPYLQPNGFSASILWSSPFVLFAVRFGARDKLLKYAAWAAIAVLCLLLWMHGNSGGWQFGYRYAMVCLPWLFVILLESAPRKLTPLEWAAYIFSFAANAWATWLFHWTEYMKP